MKFTKGCSAARAGKSWPHKGAKPQRLLWASTSSKNPSFKDTKYVEALIGPDTVDTVPLETIEAFRDHGIAARYIGPRFG